MISGFDQYVSHARGVIVGDMHGTIEAPAFLTDLVCNFTHTGRAIALGLEYPSSEQHFIDEYLRESKDSPRPALLSTPFWTRPTQDGRTSQAMLKLLYSIREQIRSGAHIRVIAFDASSADTAATRPRDGAALFDWRDAAMAEYLRHELSNLNATDIPIIFAGNVHARKTKGLHAQNAPPGMVNAEPLGYRLRDLGFLDIDIDYRGGTLWTCFSPSDCGVHDGGERGRPVRPFAIAPSADSAYDLKYLVGSLTASPPAATKK
ncbi:MAG TPA: hypothetical protein VK696_10530 [Steroidobacteraceae bacterium]|nr:hypothetical protein [Steroidobacteraceae bacterium]